VNGEKPERELSVNEIFSLTFNLYFSKFLQFFLPFLVSGIILGISTYTINSVFPLPEPPTLPTDPGTAFIYEEFFPWFSAFISTLVVVLVLSALTSWIVTTTAASMVAKSASDQLDQGTSSLGGSLNFTIGKLPSLLASQFVVGILTAIGLLLLVVPGIIVGIMFSLVIPVIVIEQRGALESLGRSKKLVSNRWLKTFALLLVLGIIIGITIAVANVVTTSLIIVHPIVNPIITYVVAAFVLPIYPIGLTYLYYSMVTRENPPPTP
jgi:hypothetical protein